MKAVRAEYGRWHGPCLRKPGGSRRSLAVNHRGYAMHVLVADDDLTYRVLLQKLLTAWGYHVTTADDGAAAWGNLESPDHGIQLALCDWVMPGVTGPEICRRLRERDGTSVYTILLTGRAEQKDILEGLQTGACDYLVKPFNPSELKARLDIGARLMAAYAALKTQNDQLERHGRELEALARVRADQLVAADRMATLGVMAAGVAHEINNPTSFISGNLQILREFMPVVERALRAVGDGDGDEAERARFVLEELPQMTASMQNGVDRIAHIVKGLRQYAHSGRATGLVDVNDSVRLAADLCRGAFKKHVLPELSLGEGLPSVRGDRQQIEQVLVNLFVNAADALLDVGGGALMVRTLVDDGMVVVVVEDTGPGIEPANLPELFKPFFTTKDVGKGTGLGLSICERIVRDHGGTLAATNREGGGARFTLALPTSAVREGMGDEA